MKKDPQCPKRPKSAFLLFCDDERPKLIEKQKKSLKQGEKFIVKSTGQTFTADTIGKFTPKKIPCTELLEGEVGYLVASVKDLKSVPVGDTLISAKYPETNELDGFEEVKPQVFASFFPIDSNDYQAFREALQKLNLNNWEHL